MYETIFPTGWGIARPQGENPEVTRLLGHTLDEIEMRARNCVYSFLETLYDPDEKGLHHYYRADRKYRSELDSGNFLMAVNYLTMYDLTGDGLMLSRAEDCFRWGYDHTTETHPMFTWQGGVRDGFKPNELYVKYTGDAFLTCVALYRRTRKDEYLFYLEQFHNFFKQARKAGFCYKYDTNRYEWCRGYCQDLWIDGWSVTSSGCPRSECQPSRASAGGTAWGRSSQLLQELAEQYRLVAARTAHCHAETSGETVAVLASLLVEQPLIAAVADVDDIQMGRARRYGGQHRLSSARTGGALPAGVAAILAGPAAPGVVAAAGLADA